MRPLIGQVLLRAWDLGQRVGRAQRAAALLEVACPGYTAPRSLSEQNRLLLDLREMSFGPRLDGYAECPQCGLALELSVPVCALRDRPASTAAGRSVEMTHGPFRLTLREAGAAELAAVAVLDDLALARRSLACKCIEAEDGDGRAVPAEELPEETLAVAFERLDTLHAGAALALELGCPGCATSQEVQLDLAEFLWAEVRLSASRLLDEVHELAWAFGWSEEEILALSPERRQAYLERVRH
jgi:hypothetical protein